MSITDESMIAFSSDIPQHFVNLQQLTITTSYRGAQKFGTNEYSMNFFFESLTCRSHKELTDKSIEALATDLAKLSQLKRLSLKFNW